MTIKFNYKDKIVLAHMGFPDRSARKEYKENSKEVCALSSKKDYIDIIELDIRKSADGVLYCYHGNLFEYHFLLKLPFTLSSLKHYRQIDTLEEVLNVIDENKSIFLDIKDTGITNEDILKHLKAMNFEEVILGNKSVRYLDRFTNMPNNFVKILNCNIFCNFYNLDRLKEKKFKYFEAVSPLQVNSKTLKKVEEAGLIFRMSGIGFLSKDSYWRKINKYGIKHVSSDFI